MSGWRRSLGGRGSGTGRDGAVDSVTERDPEAQGSQVAVETEQAVLQTRKTVEDLVKLADELTRSLSRFKLATA